MKTFLILVILPFLIVAPLTTDLIQTPGPHGGKIKKADQYYIEQKSDDHFVYTYLLDSRKRTMSSKNVTCTARFFLSDSTDLVIALKPFGDNGFSGEHISGYKVYKITYVIDVETKVSALFDSEKLVAEKQ